MDFQLKTEFIELDNMLKAQGLVASGAEAKQRIQSGAIKVNGQVETRIRRKLRSGDSVELGEHRISIVSEKPEQNKEGMGKMDLEKAKTFMQEVGWCDLATTDGKEVGVRPMAGYIWVGKELWFATMTVTDKIKQLAKVNHAEYCFTKPTGGHLRISGTMVVSSDSGDKKKLYDAVPILKEYFKDPADPLYVVLRLTPNRIRWMGMDMMRYEDVAL
jgi:ribosome-associated protein